MVGIDPNSNNIDTNAGIGIDWHQCDEINTLELYPDIVFNCLVGIFIFS